MSAEGDDRMKGRRVILRRAEEIEGDGRWARRAKDPRADLLGSWGWVVLDVHTKTAWSTDRRDGGEEDPRASENVNWEPGPFAEEAAHQKLRQREREEAQSDEGSEGGAIRTRGSGGGVGESG